MYYLSYFVVNEITITGSRCGSFEPALQLLDRGLVKLPEIEFWDLKDMKRPLPHGHSRSDLNLDELSLKIYGCR